MRRIALAVVLAVIFPAAPLTSEAQQSAKPPRIGMLFLGSQSIQAVVLKLSATSSESSVPSRGRPSRSRHGSRTADSTGCEGWRPSS